MCSTSCCYVISIAIALGLIVYTFHGNVGQGYLSFKQPLLMSSSSEQIKDTAKYRTRLVKEMCEKHKDYEPLKKLISNETSLSDLQLFYSDSRNFLFCMVNKVSSNTWMMYLKSLALLEKHGTLEGLSLQKSKLRHISRQRLARTFYRLPKNARELDQKDDLFSFSFVRHPISRLSSAFYFLTQCPRGDYRSTQCKSAKNFRRNILLHYRNITNIDTDHTSAPTPDEFVRYVLDSVETIGFLDVNPYFKPQWASCPYCRMDYGFIGKLETFSEDLQDVAGRLGLQGIWTSGKHYNSRSTSLTTDDNFWSNVSKELQTQFIQTYHLDFDFFGYEKNF